VEARRLAALLHLPDPPVQPAPPTPGAAVEAQAGGSTRSPASSPQQQRQGRAYFAARLQELGERHALALAGLVQGGTAYHHSGLNPGGALSAGGTARSLVGVSRIATAFGAPAPPVIVPRMGLVPPPLPADVPRPARQLVQAAYQRGAVAAL
jgi:hypothetical protein